MDTPVAPTGRWMVLFAQRARLAEELAQNSRPFRRCVWCEHMGRSATPSYGLEVGVFLCAITETWLPAPASTCSEVHNECSNLLYGSSASLATTQVISLTAGSTLML